MAESTPPPLTPDDKDWTWVLEQTCPECGFEAGAIDAADVGGMIRDNAGRWQRVLATSDVRERPRPDRWSPLEYGCHVRDVFRIYLHRLDRMLTEDGPHYANWDQNETAVKDRYDLADPTVVRAELGEHGRRLADRFESVTGDQWLRTGFRGDGASFTVESFARYFIHDPIHHIDDVEKGFARLG